MADTIKISELTEVNTCADSDYIVVDDGTQTSKITVENYNSASNATALAYATAAAGSASDALGYKNTCQNISTSIQGYVTTAEDAATNAGTYAGNALASANAASGYQSTASTAATNASTYASNASNSATSAASNATLAQSWAEGGTGVRVDEATNNAKYWASVAEVIAGGGVLTFNGRGGIVTPQAGDYDADIVNYDNTNSGLLATNVEAAIDEVVTALSGKQDTLSFDNTPTAASTKPVTSTGIKDYVDTTATGLVSATSGATGTNEGQVQISVTKNSIATTTDITVNGWDKLVGQWTSTVTCALGATSAAFTNPFNTTSVAVEAYIENSSGTPVGYNTMTTTASTITLAFDALEEAADIKLLIKDLS